MLKRQITMNSFYDKNADKADLTKNSIFISAEDIIDLDLLETKLTKGEQHIAAETENEVIVIPDDFESDIFSGAVINDAKLADSRTKNKFANVCDKDVEHLDFENQIISNVVIKDATLIDSRSKNIFVDLCDKSVDYLKLNDIGDQYFVPVNRDKTLLLESKSKTLHPADQTEGFEAVYFPEVYEGIAIETPFFDIDLYKERLGQSSDDVRHVDHSEKLDQNFHNNMSSVNVISGEFNQTSVGDAQNSYTPNIEPIIIDLDTDDELDFQDSYHENVYQSRDQSNCDSNTRTEVRAKKKDDTFFHCSPRINVAGKIKMGSNSEATEVDGKYQCHKCTYLRVFDTLVALNNHLTFEHLVLFNG